MLFFEKYLKRLTNEIYSDLPQRGCIGCSECKAIIYRKIRYYVRYIEKHKSNKVVKVVLLAAQSNDQ